MIPTIVEIAAVLVIAVVGYFIWDQRYRGSGKGSFKPTNEVFKDPTTGKMTRVYEDPASGKREYREEETH
ncbi:MAG TPA: hypothetical protein VGG90_02735 [Candidatus Dormibacteraeota bacterium]|jgi:hypothetical protein